MRAVRLGRPGPEDKIILRVNGRPVEAFSGETVATALAAAGITTLQISKTGQERGLLCGMGVCFGCLATIDGLADQRTCQTLVRDGMEIEIHEL